MDSFKLNLDTEVVGGYFSSEQIDLLTIIRCKFPDELIDFVFKCEQIKNIYDRDTLLEICMLGEEVAKRRIFKDYQDTLVYHDTEKENNIRNKLKHCGITNEDIHHIINLIKEGKKNEIGDYLKTNDRYKDKVDEIFKLNHRFVSLERDQLKADDMFEEFLFLNSKLENFNTMLIGSGRIYETVNSLYSENEKEKRYDFYKTKRDLDFAYKNGKQVRYHSLLVRNSDDFFGIKENEQVTDRKKEEIIDIIRNYVKSSIDFIHEYNSNHTITRNGKQEPVIHAIDLFNEIVTFDEMVYDEEDKIWRTCKLDKATGNYKVEIGKNLYRDLKDGEIPDYRNSWEIKYGITLEELLPAFQYALDHKPSGVSYLYNEPFMENDKRRKKVLGILDKIDILSPGLIDTIGTQTHITITDDPKNITRCFQDLAEYQRIHNKKVQITEFDMSLGHEHIFRVFGNNADKSLLGQVYQLKELKMKEVEKAIIDSGVVLSGVSYWSLTDGIDSNLERLRSNALSDHVITNIHQIPTACGGLYPTHKKYIRQMDIQQNQTETLSNGKKLVRKLDTTGKISFYFILGIILLLFVALIINIIILINQ